MTEEPEPLFSRETDDLIILFTTLSVLLIASFSIFCVVLTVLHL